MIMQHLILTLLTLVSTLFSSVLALPGEPSDPDFDDGVPPSGGFLPLVKTLQRLGFAGIKLDRTLEMSQITPETLQTTRQLTQDIENIVTQATAEADALEVLDPIRSTKLTKKALPMKPVFGHLLKVISNEKGELCAAQFCHEMQDFLTWMRIRCHGLAESLRGIVRFGDGKLIEVCADLIDKQYAMTITEYEKPIRSGRDEDQPHDPGDDAGPPQ
ncbi:hypothetical protein ASPACDRAFT_1860717 [Aspergillus aculeatus ATCC 16872]|uniref:Secreted protein n=1 Tax=Aspergillus aculeatus (strain ATCC 16872 / CBS 172.66 / WB 5094) TaxID=690307 RepID=A0A1L9WEU8_ASPA1|nr:uncharacterized protein ASPACDRAFT_1860717 [Aspergillus aculeatus ATCC 16872]OJJ94699.1 hypothetical protein ASPACDRAFT_1860717 [Aspergillus aculeatus ATCC 16872]